MLSKQLRVCGVAVLAAAMLTGACGGSEPAPASQAPPPGAKRVDDTKVGAIAGRVTYEGPAVAEAPMKLDGDPACAREHPNGLAPGTVVVNEGGLENVFVYVKDGLGAYFFDTPTEPVKLDQKGCQYAPHVFGVRAGQPIEIVNSDALLHTVHGMGTANREFNFSQQLQGMTSRTTFTAPEIMVRFKCDVHSWMSAYAGVVAHPYFAVTANGGGFELKGVPAGTYTIEAWHEKFGTQTQSVTLADKEAKAINFTFK